MFFQENFVRAAVEKAGGATYTSNQLNVSNGCVYKWIKAGRISKINQARKLSELSGISVEKLRGAA